MITFPSWVKKEEAQGLRKTNHLLLYNQCSKNPLFPHMAFMYSACLWGTPSLPPRQGGCNLAGTPQPLGIVFYITITFFVWLWVSTAGFLDLNL